MTRVAVGRDDRGAALPAVILVALIVASIIGTIMISSLGGRNVSDTGQLNARASAAASAGIAEAEARIKTAGNPVSLCPSTTVSGSLGSNSATFSAVITCGPGGRFEIAAEGRAGGAVQAVNASV